MANLDALRDLATFMRSVGATHARDGEIELHLGPLPPAVGVAAPPSHDVDEPDSLEALLYGTGLDPQMFRGAAQ